MKVLFLILSLCLGDVQSSSSQSEVTDFESLPAVQWKFRTNAPILASPFIHGNLAYVGSGDSVLYALDIETGKSRWTFRIQGPILSTVCIGGDQLFLLAGDGSCYSLDKNSGKMLWRFKTRGEKVYQYYGYADYHHSSPVLYKSIVYFGSGDGNVYALKSNNGKVLWSFKTGDVVHSSPVVGNDKLFIGSFDGHVYALDCQSGALVWKFKSVGHRFFPKGEMQGSPVTANGLVYIGSRDYNLYAIDAEKGYCHWNKQFPKGWAMALSVRDTVLYVGTSDDDLMIAMDGRSGAELWRTDMKFNMFGTCTFTSSMMYFGTLLGKIHGLDLQTGAIRWTFNTDGYNEHHSKYFPSESVIVKNDFYASLSWPDGYITALHELGAIFSKPAISENLIIVSSTDGTVYCLRK